MIHDVFWWPKLHRCSGAFAIFCPRTLRYHIHRVHIPLRLDNSYTAEQNTAWAALSTRGTASDPTFVYHANARHFAECKLYTAAQEGSAKLEHWSTPCKVIWYVHAAPSDPGTPACTTYIFTSRERGLTRS